MKILISDDNISSIEILKDQLVKFDHEVIFEENYSATLKRIRKESSNLDAIMIDKRQPIQTIEGVQFNSGEEFGNYVSKKYPDLYLVMITAFHEEQLPEKVLTEYGFHEYLNKDNYSSFELQMVLTRAKKFRQIQKEKNYLQNLRDRAWFELNHKLDENLNIESYHEKIKNYIGPTPKMLQVLKYCERYANTDLPVLITGDSGTGKEIIAKIISQLRFSVNKSDEKFVVVNCSAIPKELVESELFGHKKGSFTGALEDKKGHFEVANEGVLFLDEIGELSLSAQAKILRAIQENKIVRVGESSERNIKVKLILATHQHIPKLIVEGKFRGDLYYRIQGMFPKLPTLKERGVEEIERLIKIFQDEFISRNQEIKSRLTDELAKFIATIEDYEWPGNVRELKNFIQNLLLLSPEGEISKSKCIEFFSAWTKKHEFIIDNTKSTGKIDVAVTQNSIYNFDEYLNAFPFEKFRSDSYANAISEIQKLIAKTIEQVALHHKKHNQGKINRTQILAFIDPEVQENDKNQPNKAKQRLKKFLSLEPKAIKWKDYNGVLKDLFTQ